MRFEGFFLLLFLLLGLGTLRSSAQEPDPLPLPDLPDMEINDSIDFTEKIDVDLLEKKMLGTNMLEFCGQIVNLDRRDRNWKLHRELEVLSRSAQMLKARSCYYFPRVEPILRANNIPDDFKYLMVVESFLNPTARSPKGAAGLWQIMPGTARDYGLIVNGRMDERYQTIKATHAACNYLNAAYRKFGDWVAVAQSYNIGQARIGNELARQQVEEAIDLHLVEETNRYIYRILAVKILFTDASNFVQTPQVDFYDRMMRFGRRQWGRRR